MRKSIKNYTTSISVKKSLGLIQDMLAAYKAEKIMIDYKDGKPVAITFALSGPKGIIPIQLPARIEKVVYRMYRTNYPRASQLEQAERTGWKNIHDWIDAQLALVETQMVKIEEVFLPYIVMEDQTIFERFASGNLLGEGK